MCIALQEYEVSDTGQDTFCLQFPCRHLVTPAAVGYGKQVVTVVRVLEPEPSDTSTLYLMFLVARFATLLDTSISESYHLFKRPSHCL